MMLPTRPYGKNGIQLSIVGLGGVVVMETPQPHANRLVAQAVEKGVNYFDVAPSYSNAQPLMGPALEPYRKNVFLACKTMERTRDKAAAELDKSLADLRTDYLDLYQLHALTDVAADVDVAFGKGGAMEAILAARRDGRIRHVGFSTHSVEAALAAMDRYEFDSALVPLNFACWQNGFGPQIVRAAQAKNVTLLAIKAMAYRPWSGQDHPLRQQYRKCWYEPLSDRRLAQLALRFTLGLPVAAALSPGSEELFQLALETAADYAPLSADERAELESIAAQSPSVFPLAK